MAIDATLEYLEQIVKKTDDIPLRDYEKSFLLLLDADYQYQHDNGNNNMDSILRLWRCYLTLIKKSVSISPSGQIKRELVDRLYETLNTYVIQGLHSLIITNSNQQQITLKLQLLNFFLQRLCATIIYFRSYFSLENISNCLLHLYCFQGYIVSKPLLTESYQSKVRELYLKFFDPSFLSSIGGHDKLINFISVKLPNFSISGLYGLAILIGSLNCSLADLSTIESSTDTHLPRVVVAYAELILKTIGLLTLYYCGLVTDDNLIQYISKLGFILSNIIQKTPQSASSILSYLFASCISIQERRSKTDNMIYSDVVEAWARQLLCYLFSVCDAVQDPVVMILSFLIRFCCGTCSHTSPRLGYHVLRSLAHTFRLIVRLCASFSKQHLIDKLMKEVYDLLNKVQNGQRETEIEVFLQWAIVSFKYPHNDTNACSTILSYALSHIPFPTTDSTESIFELKSYLYCRSVSLLAGLTSTDFTFFPIGHIQRVFNGDRQHLIIDHSFKEIRLIFLYYSTSLAQICRNFTPRKRSLLGTPVVNEVSYQPVFLPKLSKISSLLVQFILSQQHILSVLTSLHGNSKFLDKYRIPFQELLQSALDIHSAILSIIPKCFTENNLPMNTTIDHQIFERSILNCYENVVHIICILLMNCLKVTSSSSSSSNTTVEPTTIVINLVNNVQNIFKHPKLSKYPTSFIRIWSHIFSLSQIMTFPSEIQQLLSRRGTQSLSSESSWSLISKIVREQVIF